MLFTWLGLLLHLSASFENTRYAAVNVISGARSKLWEPKWYFGGFCFSILFDDHCFGDRLLFPLYFSIELSYLGGMASLPFSSYAYKCSACIEIKTFFVKGGEIIRIILLFLESIVSVNALYQTSRINFPFPP